MFPWFAAAMLAFEANQVIALRLFRLALGGAEAEFEAKLMISEKVDAGIEAGFRLVMDGNIGAVIGRYREHVAANALRLSKGR